MDFRGLAEKYIKRHEGFKQFIYLCTSGKRTIGYGRNLDNRGITIAEAEFLIRNDIDECEKKLTEKLDFYSSLSDTRKTVLIDMCFNIGINGLLKFKNMLEFSRQGEFSKAAIEILKSEYAKQVKNRAIENAKAYESNTISV